MGQSLENIPRTREEYRRQKGRIPVIAIAMCVCLIVAFLGFFVPAYIATM